MYREMLEAFAAGDKDALERLCQSGQSQKLAQAIDRRKLGEVVRFEVLKYKNPIVYPRLLSHITMDHPNLPSTMIEQAVVGISSRQQVDKVNSKTGQVVPGSLRIQDKVEYVVVNRLVDTLTWETAPFKIWGTTSATTMEEYEKDALAIEKETMRLAGWTGPDAVKGSVSNHAAKETTDQKQSASKNTTDRRKGTLRNGTVGKKEVSVN